MARQSASTSRRSVRAGVGLVAVLAAAAIVALVLLQWRGFGPFAGASVEPTASIASQAGTATAPASPTSEPTIAPTPAPTAQPTPRLAWEGLAWQSATKEGGPDAFTWIGDVVQGDGNYVGIGGVYHLSGSCVADLAFFTGDGSAWTTSQTVPGVDSNCSGPLVQLVRTSGGYLAVVVPMNVPAYGALLWLSTDGVSWTQLTANGTANGWDDAWAYGPSVRIAAGPEGLVAIGTDAVGAHATVRFSTDGRSWEPADLPASQAAIPRDVAAFGGGFVIVGRDGAADVQDSETGGTFGVGRPAAWISADGRTWAMASVDGDAVAGGELRRILVGVDGLMATGIDTDMGPTTADETRFGPGTVAWTSSDGREWRISGQIGADLPIGLFASDGKRIVIFGRDETTVDEHNQVDSAAWASVDGRSWVRLADANGKAPRFYSRQASSECAGCPAPGDLWVVDDGIFVTIVAGAPAQGVLFGAAVPR
jgi:hypothetical protein